EEVSRARTWRTNLWLFVATIASTFVTWGIVAERAPFFSRAALVHSAQFSGSLLTILVAHELGHYVAARIHKVDASLPYFIPLPVFSPFGTMGAVIRMRARIPTRAALLDIGASGPLAGLVFAIPLYAWGIAHSSLVPLDSEYVQLGSSLLIRLLDRIAAPPVPDGMDLLLSPAAFRPSPRMFLT